jgi:hypothetical protein
MAEAEMVKICPKRSNLALNENDECDNIPQTLYAAEHDTGEAGALQRAYFIVSHHSLRHSKFH